MRELLSFGFGCNSNGDALTTGNDGQIYRKRRRSGFGVVPEDCGAASFPIEI
jgi:hypothetical protein